MVRPDCLRPGLCGRANTSKSPYTRKRDGLRCSGNMRTVTSAYPPLRRRAAGQMDIHGFRRVSNANGLLPLAEANVGGENVRDRRL